MSTVRVLCVDDEPHVLEGLERVLFDEYDVATAQSGAEGLALLSSEAEQFEVIVSDMRMPEMNGAQFLSRVSEASPESVRLLLTGQSDIQSAASAVNEGGVFRFLIKPCPPAVLKNALNQAAEQYRLQKVERDILEKTLVGAIESLMGLLGVTSVNVEDDSAYFRDVVRVVASGHPGSDSWRCETTALLWHMAYAVLPDRAIDLLREGKHEADETEMLVSALETAATLVENIPRLEDVATLIRALAGRATRTPVAVPNVLAADLEALEGARRFVTAVHCGASPTRAATDTLPRVGAPIREQLSTLTPPLRGSLAKAVDVDGLRVGAYLHADAVSLTGATVARAGHRLTGPLIQRLQNFHQSTGLQLPLQIAERRVDSES